VTASLVYEEAVWQLERELKKSTWVSFWSFVSLKFWHNTVMLKN